MKYQMREQMFAIGDDYWIETDTVSLPSKLTARRSVSARPSSSRRTTATNVLTIQEKLLSIRDQMEIERDATTVATVANHLAQASPSLGNAGGRELGVLRPAALHRAARHMSP